MYLPQLTVVLRLVNHTELSRKKRSYFSDYPLKRTDAYPAENMTWIYLEDDLPNLASQTVVFIVVDDINDNPPTFVSVKRAVGYPTKDLFEEILPSYVTSVEVNCDSLLNCTCIINQTHILRLLIQITDTMLAFFIQALMMSFIFIQPQELCILLINYLIVTKRVSRLGLWLLIKMV